MGEEFTYSERLQAIVEQILKHPQLKFVEEYNFAVKVVETDKDSAKWVAKCVKMNPLQNFINDLDFVILVRTKEFSQLNPEAQAKVLIHECRHIDFDENSKHEIVSKLRSHSDRFCTHLSHERNDSLVTEIFNDVYPVIKGGVERLPRSQAMLDAYVEA